MNPDDTSILITCVAADSVLRSLSKPIVSLPVGTPLPVQIDDHLPMRVGQPIRAQLIYPVYANDTLVLPAKTIVIGSVTALRSNHSRRISARLRGDFTPFNTPIVSFTGITLADGSILPISTGTATDGVPSTAS
jgi:hypothetical protein